MTQSSAMGFVRVSGADAAVFINGQFTHNTLNMDAGDARFGAFCNPKGRALATAFILATTEGFELWSLNAALPSLIAGLRRYVMRSKVVFDDAPSIRHATCTLPHGATLQLDSPTIEAQAIAAGVPLIHAANSEAFVPQMINLDLLDGIDFAKGCYTGQEIVARTQNLGTIKRRMLLFGCENATRFAPGDKVTAAGSSVGAILGASENQLLASIRLAVVGEQLVAGDDSLPLGKMLALPYEIPELAMV